MRKPSLAEIREILRSIALKYPGELVPGQLRDVDRVAYHINLVVERKGVQISICDLGGGIGLFSVGCAALGMRSTLIDDFADDVNRQFGDSVLEVHRAHGVQVLQRDPVAQGIDFAPGSLGAATSFDAMEHFHHSPKALFAAVSQTLEPGGLFVLGVPNCVNLRKRISVPFGYGKWSSIEDWYESDRFRGHVREPDVADLRYIARDMGMSDAEIVGRNWVGYFSDSAMVRWATRASDHLLRLHPPLCSDIYLLARKP